MSDPVCFAMIWRRLERNLIFIIGLLGTRLPLVCRRQFGSMEQKLIKEELVKQIYYFYDRGKTDDSC